MLTPPSAPPSLRSVPHIGPLTPFPRHPQASTGGRHRRRLKDVLRTCQETLTYSTHLPLTLSVCLPLLLKSTPSFSFPIFCSLFAAPALKIYGLMPSLCQWDGRSLDNMRCLYDCRLGHLRVKNAVHSDSSTLNQCVVIFNTGLWLIGHSGSCLFSTYCEINLSSSLQYFSNISLQ